MEAQRWQKIKSAFEIAVEAAPESRDEALRRFAGEDEEVVRDVLSLLAADSATESFMESPCLEIAVPADPDTANDPVFRDGEIVAGRYEIVRLLGSGGMGQVYEAIDTELGGQVALKTLGNEVSRSATMLAQFRQEVSVARRVTHANVCRTFDIERIQRANGPDETEEIFCLTMEYLAGETLQQRLKRSRPLPLEQTLSIARQMAEALRAAHAIGVIHRDIKPANVMLVPDGSGERAVVTDFGLARFTVATDGRHAALSKLGVIGTPAYMAPEQMRGEQVSTATDIYSFGLVLFEMVTGSQADLAVLANEGQTFQQWPAIQGLPPEWQVVLRRCLKIVPAERFPSAAELLQCVQTPSAITAFSPPPLPAEHSSTGQWIMFASALALCVALIATGLRLYERRTIPQIAAGSSVLFSGVTNHTGDRALENVTQLMQNQLAQTARFNLLDQDRVQSVLQTMMRPPDTVIDGPVAREIAMRAGAVRVAHGEINATGNNNYVLTMTVEQPDNTPARPRHTWQQHWSWQAGSGTSDGKIPTGLLNAVRESSDWVRHEVGESADDLARLDAPPEDVTTSNWEALERYAEAENFKKQLRNQDAVSALRNAVAADPGFALAFARLGDVLSTLGRQQEAYAAYESALSATLERRLTRRERDRIRGIFAIDTKDYAAADRSFQDYETFYEYDYLGWFYRGAALVALGRTDEAIQGMERAAKISPDRLFAPEHLARYELLKSDYAASERWAAELDKHGYPAYASQVRGLAAFLQGKVGDAERLVQAAEADQSTRWLALAVLGRFYTEEGRDAEAVQVLQQAASEAKAAGDTGNQARRLNDLAYMACRDKQFSQCLRLTEEARGVETDADLALEVSTVLGAAARDGDASARAAAMRQLQAWQKALPTQLDSVLSQLASLRLQGELQLAQGRWAEAADTMRKAADMDAPAGDREYLGRALLQLANHTQDPNQAGQLREQSRAAYAIVADHPAVVWSEPHWYLPGYVADSRRAMQQAVQ